MSLVNVLLNMMEIGRKPWRSRLEPGHAISTCHVCGADHLYLLVTATYNLRHVAYFLSQTIGIISNKLLLLAAKMSKSPPPTTTSPGQSRSSLEAVKVISTVHDRVTGHSVLQSQLQKSTGIRLIF